MGHFIGEEIRVNDKIYQIIGIYIRGKQLIALRGSMATGELIHIKASNILMS